MMKGANQFIEKKNTEKILYMNRIYKKREKKKQAQHKKLKVKIIERFIIIFFRLLYIFFYVFSLKHFPFFV